MKFREAIGSGFRIVNRNWQLVLIQVGAMFASFIGFLILVGIPLAIAFIIFGLDLTELARVDDVFRTLREPAEILSKYFALVVLVLTSLLLYITAVLALGIFLFGGSVGVITRFVRGNAERFEMKTFLAEGRRLFFPLVGFTSLVAVLFIIVAFVLGLFGGLISAIVAAAKEQEAALALFLGVFFSLILFVAGLALVLAVLAITVYGSACLAMRGAGPVKSFRESVRYLSSHAGAFSLYCLVFGGYLAVNFMVLGLSYPIGLVPFIGSVIAFFYQFAAYVVQSYTGLVMIAALFSYYHSTAGGTEEKETRPVSPSEGSIGEIDTSGAEAQVQDAPPPEKDRGNER